VKTTSVFVIIQKTLDEGNVQNTKHLSY